MFFNAKALVVSTLLAGATVASPVPAETKEVMALDKRQNAPIGTAIFGCTQPNVVALTFDDGIHQWTDQALDILGQNNMKATFFLNGDNYALLSTYSTTLRRMFNAGHQIGSHTWDHPSLTDLSSAEVRDQMIRFEQEMRGLIGYYPTYMRPPFFDYDSNTLSIMGDLNYRVVITDIDTNDWSGDIDASFNNFRQGLDNGGSIVLAHDVYESTVTTLLPMMIDEIKSRNLQTVTVGECLGEGYGGWYRVTPRS